MASRIKQGSRMYGTVIKKTNSSKWVIHWDIDGQEFDIGRDKLLLELYERVPELVDNDMETDDDRDNHDQMPQPKPGKAYLIKCENRTRGIIRELSHMRDQIVYWCV